MAYAANTSVPVERSRAEIERLLSRHKCNKFLAGVDHDAHTATVQFHAYNRIIRFIIGLPDPKDKKYTRDRRGYTAPAHVVDKLVAQDERTRWRALLLVIKAKLEAVESNIATFEDEFLAHVVLPNQQTVAQYIGPAVAQMCETGRMAPDRMLNGTVEEGTTVDAVREDSR